jgi:succinate-semialdehyde dehydrogenase/glutarate-semialdehyde dehydrogenase
MNRLLCFGGAWKQAQSGEVTPIYDPATYAEVGTSAVAGAADINQAVEVATEGFQNWKQWSPDERSAVLRRAAELVEERAEKIGVLLTKEQGKPLADSVKEINFGAEVIRYYAEEARRIGGTVRPTSRHDIRPLVSYSPLGVVGAIVPWNYPVDLYAWKVGPALAAGNSIIVKPPIETPLAVAEFVACFYDAGLPEGVLSDMPGAFEAGSRLASHPGIAAITATASTPTGQSIMRSAADSLKKVTLELGGHCPFIVLDHADVEAAAKAAARRSFSNAGQICIAVNRIYVHDSVADEFVDAIAEEAEKIVLGHGLADGVTCGPVTTRAVARKTQRHLDDALDRGAKLVTGSGAVELDDKLEPELFITPKVVDYTSPDSLVMNEETFGPLVAVERFTGDVVEQANRAGHGLAAYVFGNDLDHSWSVAEKLEAGGVGVNINDVTELQAPFGGWKMSGFGRELGPEGLYGMLQAKHIRIKRNFV